MQDISSNWFVAQLLAAVCAFALGRRVADRSDSWGEILLVLATILAVAWAVRSTAQDAIVRLVPLDVLVYLEGTIIVPPFMVMAGVASARLEGVRAKRIGLAAASFGIVYLVMNGFWMLAPRVNLQHTASTANASPLVITQSRDDTCVAAALATALNSPGIRANTTEAEMARLADVRVGQGATMLRALRAARARLAGSPIEARLYTCSSSDAIRMSSYDRPVLVTVRSSVSNTHMIAILGATRSGDVFVADPAAFTETPIDVLGVLPAGVRIWRRADLDRRYMGQAIAFTETESPRSKLLGRR